MFLLYLDASGTAETTDPTSSHYVLTGLCMREHTWFGLERRLQALKRLYALPGTDFEIHVRRFAGTISEQSEVAGFESLSPAERRQKVLGIRKAKIDAAANPKEKKRLRRKFDVTDPFVHLSRAERSRLLEDSIDLIASHNGIRLFSEAISKNHPAVISKGIDPAAQAFEQVVSRFDTFLQKIASRRFQKNQRYPASDRGLLILDRDVAKESMIESAFKHFREHGHSFGELVHVIDVPFFSQSSRVSGLQLVDVCAYVTRRYLEKLSQSPSSHEERHFRALFPLFDRDVSGRLHGIRHYVPANTCNCMICKERGHAP